MTISELRQQSADLADRIAEEQLRLQNKREKAHIPTGYTWIHDEVLQKVKQLKLQANALVTRFSSLEKQAQKVQEEADRIAARDIGLLDHQLQLLQKQAWWEPSVVQEVPKERIELTLLRRLVQMERQGCGGSKFWLSNLIVDGMTLRAVHMAAEQLYANNMIDYARKDWTGDKLVCLTDYGRGYLAGLEQSHS